MKKNLFLAVVLAFSVRSAARAEQLQSWGESLQARLNALPSEQAFQTYPQQYVVVAIIGVPNVPEPGALTNPKLDDVLRIVQNRKTYWKGTAMAPARAWARATIRMRNSSSNRHRRGRPGRRGQGPRLPG